MYKGRPVLWTLVLYHATDNKLQVYVRDGDREWATQQPMHMGFKPKRRHIYTNT